MLLRLLNLTRWLIFGGIWFLAGLLLLSTHLIMQYQAQVILSDSMRPTFSAGSVVITKLVPAQKIQVGDVVSFRPPTHDIYSVTHRITKLYPDRGGPLVIETKGDANSNGDPWRTPLGSVSGKKVLALPWIGYLLYWFKTPLGFLSLALLIFFLTIAPQLRLLGELYRQDKEQNMLLRGS